MSKTKDSTLITIFMLALALFGSLMIASAEMGNAQGETGILIESIVKQVIIVLVSFFVYTFFKTFRLIGVPLKVYYLIAGVVAFLLVLPLAYHSAGGAHAWIRFGIVSIQPSEFAKCFAILFGAKLFCIDRKENNRKYMAIYSAVIVFYSLIIIFLEKDFGSAVVLLGISYCILLIPIYKGMKRIHNYLIIGLIVIVGFAAFLMSPLFTKFCESHAGNYMLGRFLAAANPFKDQFNTGYNLILALVSFATGGVFGLGYSNSIHKYMNFPNPSTDFILPVIVEETGIIGFAFILICYIGIMIILMRYSLKFDSVASRIIFMGTFMYFALHFIFNVGGVSGLIPLTGVPLLMLSSGGSSTMAAMIVLGICQAEIVYNNERLEKNESN